MNETTIFKCDQEQALASWINYLNQIRLDQFIQDMGKQDQNLSEALKQLKWAELNINEVITRNRGGETGIHGFLAEILETGINNAQRLVRGKQANMTWLNDNGMIDLVRDGEGIQQKFYQSDGLFSLTAASRHLQQYPDFLKNGMKYQIPKDQYQKVIFLANLGEKEAYHQLSAATDPTISQWRKVHRYFENSELSVSDFEPAHFNYNQAQKSNVSQTISEEKQTVYDIDRQRRNAAYDKNKPSFSQGSKITIASAFMEGLTAFCLEIAAKRKTKPLSDFSKEDWSDISKKTGFGFVKGGIRGSSIYVLSNFTATPAFVANAMVTASFSIAEQVHLYRKGTVSELDLIESSEILCLEAAVSALSSILGQTAIPVPVLGAIIGSTIGNVLFQVSRNYCSEQEKALFNQFLERQAQLDQHWNSEYSDYLDLLNKNLTAYLQIVDEAFAPDPYTAFRSSVQLSEYMGAFPESILRDLDTIDSYFMT